MRTYYRGIETNNLKNIDVTIPHNKIILILGVSGSGKSSLAIDTIHSISANELSQLMNINEFAFEYSVKHCENILPSVSLRQENYNTNPRSTIATYFGLDRFFKYLFSSNNNISPATFQFNRYKNACKKCLGIGTQLELDPVKVIDYNTIIKNIPFLNWRGSYSDFYKQLLSLYCKDNNIDISKRLLDIDDRALNLLLRGKSIKKYKIGYKYSGRKRVKTSQYIGPLNGLNIFSGIRNKQYYTEKTCPECGGFRFSENILLYKLYNKNIGELYTAEIETLVKWIYENKSTWGGKKSDSSAIKSVLSLLKIFIDLNIGYLSLNRSIPSLSGGELQRLRLAKSINSQFSNFLYILDEPSAGLHPKEFKSVSDSISKLKQKGNTVIIVEHKHVFDKIADKKIILGPTGGKGGGYILKTLSKSTKEIPYCLFESTKSIDIKNESYNNIRKISTTLPLNSFVVICGVSGSGKTSFLNGILPKYLKNSVSLNQRPLSGNSYSIVATYLDILDEIKIKFASTSGLKPGFFSFHHSSEGKCKTCNGSGFLKDEMTYITAGNIVCPKCEGKRFNKNVLGYYLKDKNIFQVLSLTVDELHEWLNTDNGFSKTIKVLSLLADVGLGYLTLFRKLSTLSGGEAQRLKICNALSKSKSKGIYLLDEPLRGVDDNNALRFISLIYDIVKKGGSVFMSEHNLLAIKYSSYIFEFGPGGGKHGGKLIFSKKL